MEEWREIYSFPGYSVSDNGRVLNLNTGRILAQVKNQRSLLYVGMMQNGVQLKRSVSVLVADAFLPPPHRPDFDTPIHLNGDKTDNRVENLVWRPRWFAILYAKQFHETVLQFIVPIMEMTTGEEFPTSWEAVTKFGLLSKDLVLSTQNNTTVFPTNQRFRVID